MPLRTLDRRRDELAEAWLERSTTDGVIHDPGRRERSRLLAEVSGLISDLLARASGTPFTAPEADLSQSVARLARIRSLAADPAAVAEDLTRLQSVIVQALGEVAGDLHPGAVLRLVDRLSRETGDLIAEAVSVAVAERSRELEALADTDPLTGLFNVRRLRRELTALVETQQRYGHPFAVLVIDVDGLKQVNDAFGHAAGDDLLAAVAGALRDATRSVDTVARMGGDEFCVLAPNQTSTGARALAERLADRVRALPRPLGTRIGVSIGATASPEHAADPRALLQLADAAMYEAKSSEHAVAVVGPVMVERLERARRAS